MSDQQNETPTPFNWSDSEEKALPSLKGVHFRIREFKDIQTKAGADAVRGVYEVIEPTEYEGQFQTEMFTLGNVKDPGAAEGTALNDPHYVLKSTRTNSFGLRGLLRLFIAADVPLIDVPTSCEAAKQHEFFADVVTGPDKKELEAHIRAGGSPEDYAGPIRTNLRNYRSIHDLRIAGADAKDGGGPINLG